MKSYSVSVTGVFQAVIDAEDEMTAKRKAAKYWRDAISQFNEQNDSEWLSADFNFNEDSADIEELPQ